MKSSRAGFTLMELLVVMLIMIVLFMIGLGFVNSIQKNDKVRAASLQIQSFYEGARDRALHSGTHRGVRLLYEIENNGSIQIVFAKSLVYLEASTLTNKDLERTTRDSKGNIVVLSRGLVYIENDKRTIGFEDVETKNSWDNLVDRGLVYNTGITGRCNQLHLANLFFTIVVSGSPGSYTYELTKDYKGKINYLTPYSVVLNPSISANQEPLVLPSGVSVDLVNSQIPFLWKSNGNYGPYLDVMFSEKGIPVGAESAVGFVNLLVADDEDVFQGRLAGEGNKVGQERIVSIHAKTGVVTTHHVDITDVNGNEKADDPFNYALLGQ